MRRKVLLFFLISVSMVVLLSLSANKRKGIGVEHTVALFSENTAQFTLSLESLHAALVSLNQDSASVLRARNCLMECRMHYKSISFFTAYFFSSETAMYNAAPKYEVEEPELELVEPMGLQQIEALLFDEPVQKHKAELLAQSDALYGSVKDLKNLLYQFNADDRQVLESIRIELIRINALYISGYDAPLVKTGISETLASSKTIQMVLQPYFEHGQERGKALAKTLQSAIAYLSVHQQFDAFDRMEYLVRYGLPLQQQLGIFIRDLGLELNTSAYLNYNAPNLFSPNFLSAWDSIPEAKRANLVKLGEKLFFDKRLSGNLKVSCGTCHKPDHYFADGNVKSPSIVPDSVLKRNTPSILYAGKQHSQFLDGRARNLVGQVKEVLFNPLEMAGKKELLNKNIEETALALSAYVASLNPLNSAFDRYLAGDRKAMTTAQIKGFNLFMGKAQCGTCHFAPYFNSLVPPYYEVSELEVIGTTKDDNFEKPDYDDDMGRFDLYKIHFYKQAFKTPTVRNAGKTAPYMHNGSFKTLESVLDFYNKGGGAGLGLNIPEQTLAAKALNLSKEECNQIIQFIHSLTDSKQTFNPLNHSHENN
jgi:cytochrome c peroxidase